MDQQQNKWQSTGGSLLFAANIFVIVLLLAGQRLAVPAWLQVAGRMHPLVLHFPIVLLLLGGGLLFIRLREPEAAAWKERLTAALLLAGALSTAVTVIMGLFLSNEEGYTAGGALLWHKWGGVVVLWAASAAYWLRGSARRWLPKAVAVLTTGALVATGHFGAVVTHGENFVLAPVTPAYQAPKIPLGQAETFAHVVQPILEEKCTGCHNPSKAKGGLSMKDADQLLAGGKTGKLFVAGDPAASLLMLRLHLPETDKKHMPPAGKPQLTEEEIAILHHWIQSGAGFKGMVKDLPAHDTLRLLAAARLQPAGDEIPQLPPADEALVAKLNNNYRVVYPVALHAAPLVANWYNAAKFDIASVKELLPVKGQLTEMHLQKMPVSDADLALIAQFRELRVLNLAFTSITGKTLGQLAGLPHLRSLSLAGTPVRAEHLSALKSAPALQKVFIWNTGVPAGDIPETQRSFARATLVNGFSDAGQEPLKLNRPELRNAVSVFEKEMQLVLRHRVRGVQIRYTTDGSAPDSINSPVFKDSLLITGNTVVRAIACKPGWYASDPVQYSFSKSTYRPDSIVLLNEPDGQYIGNGAKTLMDAEKGDFNYGNGKWLGYNSRPMDALVVFAEPVPLRSVTLSTFRHLDAYIFPPEQIEVWGGTGKDDMRLLKKMAPPPGKKGEAVSLMSYDCSFPEAKVSCVKIVLKPVAKIPQWHPGKGNRGWVFVDEVLFN